MAIRTYENVLELAECLAPCDRMRLIEELSQGRDESASSEISSGKKHNVLELRGLGKEFWQTMDTDEYLRNERSSWDG